MFCSVLRRLQPHLFNGSHFLIIFTIVKEQPPSPDSWCQLQGHQNHRVGTLITSYSSTGTPGTCHTCLTQPRGVAVAPNGDFLIADTGNERVLILNSNCKSYFHTNTISDTFTAQIGKTGQSGKAEGMFKGPYSIDTFVPGGDDAYHMAVADRYNMRITIFNQDGDVITNMSSEKVCAWFIFEWLLALFVDS